MEVKSFKTENPPIIQLKPLKGWVSIGLREIAEYHELLYFLIWRDVSATALLLLITGAFYFRRMEKTFALQGCSGNKSKAARMLGISRKAFYKRLRECSSR